MAKWKRGVRAESCEVQTEHGVWLGDALTSGQATVLTDAHNTDIDALAAEVDELQRRLDAIKARERDNAESQCYCDFDLYGNRTLWCEHCEHAAEVIAIAEGHTE